MHTKPSIAPSSDAPSLSLSEWIHAKRISQSIYVAAKLGIADLLEDGSQCIAKLAEHTHTHGPSLYRVLRALASVGIFEECDGQHFQLTPSAEALQTDVPGSMRDYAIMHGEDFHYRPWGQLLYTVKTGKPAFDREMGIPAYAYLASHPEAAAIFDGAMGSYSHRESEAIIQAYDFSSIRVLADIGGGQGALLFNILNAHPHMQGYLVDQSHALAKAGSKLEASQLSERHKMIEGDLFGAWPTNADAYLLKNIVHGFDDVQALELLQHSRSQLPYGAKLLVIEKLLDPSRRSASGELLDLELMVMLGGQSRSEADMRSLFQQAGFGLQRVVPTTVGLCVLEGV